jgi:hypothetical protein
MPDVRRPVFFCGENPAMTLYVPGSDRPLAIASYWHCTYSELGSGRALVFWSEQHPNYTDSAFGSGIFTDRIPLARMLVETLAQYFPEFQGIPITDLPYVPAVCGHVSDGRQRYSATCTTDGGTLSVEWADPLDQKQISWPAFPAGPQSFDLTTVICPVTRATIAIDGRALPGEIQIGENNGYPSSSAFLAFAETWVGPM